VPGSSTTSNSAEPAWRATSVPRVPRSTARRPNSQEAKPSAGPSDASQPETSADSAEGSSGCGPEARPQDAIGTPSGVTSSARRTPGIAAKGSRTSFMAS